MTIKILGSGCPNCERLAANVKKAAAELGISGAHIERVYDIDKIIAYGVISVPALVVDEQVKAAGRIPSVEEIKEWLK